MESMVEGAVAQWRAWGDSEEALPGPLSAWRTPPSRPAPFCWCFLWGQLQPSAHSSSRRPGPEQHCRAQLQAPRPPSCPSGAWW